MLVRVREGGGIHSGRPAETIQFRGERKPGIRRYPPHKRQILSIPQSLLADSNETALDPKRPWGESCRNRKLGKARTLRAPSTRGNWRLGRSRRFWADALPSGLGRGFPRPIPRMSCPPRWHGNFPRPRWPFVPRIGPRICRWSRFRKSLFPQSPRKPRRPMGTENRRSSRLRPLHARKTMPSGGYPRNPSLHPLKLRCLCH